VYVGLAHSIVASCGTVDSQQRVEELAGVSGIRPPWPEK
jgi:hypothetical protein